jgi:hypothetical protein
LKRLTIPGLQARSPPAAIRARCSASSINCSATKQVADAELPPPHLSPKLMRCQIGLKNYHNASPLFFEEVPDFGEELHLWCRPGRSQCHAWRLCAHADYSGLDWSKVKPFAMARPSQFRPGPPVSLDSNEWATDYNEIKDYAGKTSAKRSPPADRRHASGSWSVHRPIIRSYASSSLQNR